MPEPAREALKKGKKSHDDQDVLREQIRAELEAEHETRLQKLAQRRALARDKARNKSQTQQRKELEELRLEERRAFYREKGYQQYVDSNGRTEWLPKEEYEWRMRRRKGRDKGREYRPAIARRRRELMLYGMAALAAILVGLMLIR